MNQSTEEKNVKKLDFSGFRRFFSKSVAVFGYNNTSEPESEEPSELDWQISEALFDGKKVTAKTGNGGTMVALLTTFGNGTTTLGTPSRYSADPMAAARVVTKMREMGHEIEAKYPLAICREALLKLGRQGNK